MHWTRAHIFASFAFFGFGKPSTATVLLERGGLGGLLAASRRAWIRCSPFFDSELYKILPPNLAIFGSTLSSATSGL
jgi:hypothetical protein